MSFFTLTCMDTTTKARVGKIATAHGTVETPCFVPCGTCASVKSLTPKDLREIGVQLVLANVYHLHLRPGLEVIQAMNGIQSFMAWDGPIVTDSGGFQATILAKEAGTALARVDDNGVTFRSHFDGSIHRFSAESAIEFQVGIGSDLIMSFDQSTPVTASLEETRVVLARTKEWGLRSLRYFQKLQAEEGIKQYLYGIIQGGSFKDLRQESANFVAEQAFDAVAIGGGTIGHSFEDTEQILSWIGNLIPAGRPRHALGLGVSPDDILMAVSYGVDTFDCVAPTRLARAGLVYLTPESGGNKTNRYRLNITKSDCRFDNKPIDPRCLCMTCQTFTRAYLRHLFVSRELLAYRLASYHNVWFMTKLCESIRSSIQRGTFTSLMDSWLLE